MRIFEAYNGMYTIHSGFHVLLVGHIDVDYLLMKDVYAFNSGLFMKNLEAMKQTSHSYRSRLLHDYRRVRVL